ncbi:MAG: SDR family NAD(P)-dependent oxidoreductase [Alphaproteobacteria bacterium]
MSDDPTPLSFARLAPRSGAHMVVVGGCGGIGRALLAAAVANGLEVAVLDLPVSLEQHPPTNVAAAIALDVRKTAEVTQAFERVEALWGGLDVLVHLPGYTLPPRNADEISCEEWDDILSVNLTSLHRVAGCAVPLMRAAGGGSIVTIASGLAAHVEKGVSAYAASKAGVIAFTKALAKENAPSIRANVVAPGPVDTAFMRGGTGRAEVDGDKDWFDKKFGGAEILKTIPMGRIAVPDDVVGPILFLAGEAARFMTGQVLWVNGGRLTP